MSETITNLLPVLIPLVILELILMLVTLIHIFTHKTYKTGSRALWVVLSFVNIIGPVLYFTIGRGEE